MKKRSYEEMTHIYGRIWILSALGMIFSYPIITCIYYGAWPGWKPVLQGLLGVAPIFWTVGLIEVLTFVPMLGTASSYLAFVTGNLTNLKVPAALTAMENAGTKPGTDEGEVIFDDRGGDIFDRDDCGDRTWRGASRAADSAFGKSGDQTGIRQYTAGAVRRTCGCLCEQKLEDCDCAACIYGRIIFTCTVTVRFCRRACSGRSIDRDRLCACTL